MDYAKVRGFNYQPSYGTTSFENWLYFNEDVFELELRRGKAYFPGMNTVRLWLSWDAYVRDPARNIRYFDRAVDICGGLGLRVVPCLLNRWHDHAQDNGGVYLDHIIKNSNWVYSEDIFDGFLEAVVAPHRQDERILLWDICNEPFSYLADFPLQSVVEPMEQAWLRRLYRVVKDMKPVQPVSYSPYPMRLSLMEEMADISDVFLVHPYYTDMTCAPETLARYRALLDDYVALARRHGKGLLTTETCWGSLDDAARARNIGVTLAEHVSRGIGFIVHALHFSCVSDLHGPEAGPVGPAGDLSFIRKDGSLRPGHDIFNAY